MSQQLHEHYLDRFRLLSHMLALVAIACGISTIIGWTWDIDVLKSVIPGLAAMNPGGSAICFILGGIGTLASHRQEKKWQRLRLLCAGVIALIALSIFLRWATGMETGLDRTLFTEKLELESVTQGQHNRMAPSPATAFLLVGFALAFIDSRLRHFWPAQFAALGVAALSLMSLFGYAYSTLGLTGIRTYIPMALNTAACFLVISLALLFARPQNGVLAVFSGTGAGGTLARRMLPVVFFFPLAAGWCVGLMHRSGDIAPVTALSIFVLSCVVLLTVLVWITAASLEAAGRKLRESEERFQLAVRGTKEGLWDWNLVSGDLYWSDRFQEMLEISAPDFKASYAEFKNRLHPDEFAHITRTLEQHTKTHERYDEEFRMRTESGKYIWVRARGVSTWNSAGRTVRMAGTVVDVTDRRMAEQAMHEARALAEKASEAKSEFLAKMSHELRTPLNSIIGLSRLLMQDARIDEEHRGMIGVVYRSADVLLMIVNDILDLAKVEAGRIELERITFALEEVVTNVVETITPLCSEKNLVFACNFDKAGLPYLLGDPMRLGRIMTTLLGNAVKYTPSGSVTLDVACVPAADGQMMVQGSVTDTGIGIPPEKFKVIFEKFSQADSSITRRFDGAGVGLYIARQLLEKMGGEIGVESTPGEGSRFWFRVPFDTADERSEIQKKSYRRSPITRLPEDERKQAASLRILVADDHPLNQIFIRKLLKSMGIPEPVCVDNGRRAVEATAAQVFDIVLMDCHMPELSGFDATREIRQREKKSLTHLPILAMTADAMLGTREKCLSAGMDEYISKPVDPEELQHLMSQWVTFPDEQAGAKSAVKLPSADVASLEGLREFCDTEEELKNFVKIFVDQSNALLALLAKACVSGDNADWVEAAHKFKGGAGMVRAETLRALCEKAQGMKVADAHDRSAILQDIQKAFDEAYASLQNALANNSSATPAGREQADDHHR